jgi:hypothetical protein
MDSAVDTTKPYGHPPPLFVGVDNKVSATKGLTFGIIGSIVSWLLPPAGIVLGILAIIYGKKGLKSTKSGIGITGIILGGFCLLFSVCMSIMIALFIWAWPQMVQIQ